MSGFADEVKQELAALPDDGRDGDVELAWLLRVGATVVVRGGASRPVAVQLETGSGATARRTFSLLQARSPVRPQLQVRAPGGVHTRQRYGVRTDDAALARRLGLVDDRGLPTPPAADAAHPPAVAWRGAFLAAGSVSDPQRAPHLEVVCGDEPSATVLAAAAREMIEQAVSVGAVAERSRVVVKSGAAIGDLLGAMGATRAYLRLDERRLRRQVRGQATRLANADGANLRRTVDAAGAQIRAVEAVVAATGWDELDPELRGVALVRLTNPEASLTELGQLVDPPLSRSAVHRRLTRLLATAAELDAEPTTGRRREGDR